jgi:putative N6-adenine-specific DNA methylase
MFDGKLRDFRSEGGIVKTEEEKRQMSEKHRFKKNREFKQRLEETEQNEEADIRSFTFHRHQMGKPNRGGHERFDRSGKGKSFGKGKDFDKKRRRYDDDDE